MKPTLITLMLMGAWALQAQAADSGQTFQPDAEMARILAKKGDPVKGKDDYDICRGCHRSDASGKAAAGYPQLAGQHPSVLIKQMEDVRAGRRDSHKMLDFIVEEVIPEEKIADIAAYLYTLPVPTTNGKGDGRMLDLGKHLYDRDCAECHGKQGEGDGTKFYPRVAGQHYAYLFRESKEGRDHGRRNSNADVVRIMKNYTDDDLAAVSDYMSRMVYYAP